MPYINYLQIEKLLFIILVLAVEEFYPKSLLLPKVRKKKYLFILSKRILILFKLLKKGYVKINGLNMYRSFKQILKLMKCPKNQTSFYLNFLEDLEITSYHLNAYFGLKSINFFIQKYHTLNYLHSKKLHFFYSTLLPQRCSSKFVIFSKKQLLYNVTRLLFYSFLI